MDELQRLKMDYYTLKNNYKQLHEHWCRLVNMYSEKTKLHTIELEDWTYSCGDGCCSDFGTRLVVNGEELTDYFEGTSDEIIGLLKSLGVNFTLVVSGDSYEPFKEEGDDYYGF
jgi:hypothetical protein